MAQHKKRLNRLLGRIMQQKAGPGEQSLFWQWLWRLDVRKQATEWTPEEKEKVRERLRSAVLRKTHPTPDAIGIRPWKRLITAAAMIAGVVWACWLWRDYSTSQDKNRVFVFSSDAHSIQQLLLPDSTEVILNYNSSIQYGKVYNEKDRRVSVSGEAWFKVHKDNLRPFIVLADNIEVRALGTAFNVEARAKESQIRVALLEGKVAVYPTDSVTQKTLLSPGHLLRYERATKSFVTTAITTNVTAWTTGGLSFNGIPLTETLDRLAAHYRLHIVYPSGKLAGKTVTSSFEKTSWQNALSNILFVHDLNYTIKDSLITIQ